MHTPFNKLLELAEKTNLKLPIEINKWETDKESNCLKRFFEPPVQDEENDTDNHYFYSPYTSSLHKKFKLKYLNSYIHTQKSGFGSTPN